MKKTIKIFSLLCISITLITTQTLAQNALSIGVEFSDMSSREEAEMALNAFSELGYKSYLLNRPTLTSLQNQVDIYNNSGTTSGAFFFHGHASKYCISWNYLDKGGDYAVGFYQNGKWKEVLGNTSFYQITDINLKNTKIGIFMGCKTAQSTDNISKYAQANGVKVTTGWVYTIYDGDTDKWTKAFFDKLKAGKTFRESYKYANTLSYTNNEAMKTHRVYGDATVKATISSSKSLSANILADFLIEDERKTVVFEIKRDNNIKESIINKIKEKFDKDFNVSDYEFETSESPDGKIYDFSYIVGNAESNHGYTALEENGNIEIYDNMGNFKEKAKDFYQTRMSTCSLENTKSIELKDYEEELISKYEKKYKGFNVSINSTKKVFDDEKMDIVLNIYIEVKDKNTGASSIILEVL